MSDLMTQSCEKVALPAPRVPIVVRPGTVEDIPFIDRLQKPHVKEVGWMPTTQLAEKIALGQVLVAWASSPCSDAQDTGWKPVLQPLGYAISSDRYFKRSDVGIVYQLNVAAEYRRSFVGAALLKAVFDRAAWGCRLFCCWCAQDIAANRFWEAMGFVPLAFRAGSRTKGRNGSPRVHIFWQKRIRAGDRVTPWWYPSQTAGGSLREDRLVLPIPPGTHWSEVMPVLEKLTVASGQLPVGEKATKRTSRSSLATGNSQLATLSQGGLRFAGTGDVELDKPKKAAKRGWAKMDPMLASVTRELNDRYLEKINDEGWTPAGGKYDLYREQKRRETPPLAALPEAKLALPLAA